MTLAHDVELSRVLLGLAKGELKIPVYNILLVYNKMQVLITIKLPLPYCGDKRQTFLPAQFLGFPHTFWLIFVIDIRDDVGRSFQGR